MLLFLFLIYWLSEVIAQTFNRIVEMIISIGKLNKEAKAKIRMLTVTPKDKIRHCSI